MAIFAFGVNGEYPCQSEFISPFKLRTGRLNVLEVNGITASVINTCTDLGRLLTFWIQAGPFLKF